MSGDLHPRETVVGQTLSPAFAQRASAGGVSLKCSQKTNSPHANARRLNASHHPNPALYTTTRDSLAYRTRRLAPAYFRQHNTSVYNQRRDRVYIGGGGIRVLRFFGNPGVCNPSIDWYGSGHWIASLIPDASLVSSKSGHCMRKFGHQWKYCKFRNYAIMQSRKLTGFNQDSADVINDSTDYKSAYSADSAIQCRSR